MFPISDDNPVRRTPIVTWVLMGACILAFLWQLSLGTLAERIIFALGVIPASLFGYAELSPEIALVPPWATMFTSMFLHGGWLHLGGNMLYLWIFGNNVEDSMTRPRYLIFYLLCGVAAALAQGLSAPRSEVPMIGASGAIAGVLGSYLIMHPRANVRVALVFIVIVRVVNLPAMLVLGAWFVFQIVSGAAMPMSDEGGVAFWAHVGGFVAGMALTPFLKRREVRLLEPSHSRPWEISTPRRRSQFPEAGRGRRSPWE
ncbi:MAG TPA: rhomboid family intramembrane serine protease [Alphaproteobacteria bacterium]|nr:rhomboid family intramembrane serine protease [Alphaproteobacteria bacterium]